MPAQKPLLTTQQQIAQLKLQGVTFEICSETEAAGFLRYGNNYLRTRSYRVLYPRRPDGTYIGLDFAALAGLSSLDRQLRSAFLGVCIDVEHFAKMKILRLAEDYDEDGYAVVSDFLASLNHAERRRLMGRLEMRAAEGDRHDLYSGNLIAHYLGRLPVWVFLEVIEFGNFATFYLFCARRWQLTSMRQEHYSLKSTKSLRNACAHNSLIIPGLSSACERTGYQTNPLIASSLTERGLKNTKSRRAKLANLRVEQMAASLFSLSELCNRQTTLARNRHALQDVATRCKELEPLFPRDGSLIAYFNFIWSLVDIWLPNWV